MNWDFVISAMALVMIIVGLYSLYLGFTYTKKNETRADFTMVVFGGILVIWGGFFLQTYLPPVLALFGMSY